MSSNLKQTLITDYFKYEKKEIEIVKGFNEKTGSWHCLECGIDMGKHNPRQLCCKSYCALNFITMGYK